MKKSIWGVRAAAVICGALGAALVSAGAHAEDLHSAASPIAPLPAVDGFNGKAEAFGGSLGKKSLGGAQGAVTLPLASTYGLQIDTASGALDGSSFANVAGHLFWRNPNQGLVGLYTSYTWWDRYGGLRVAHVGAEGEFYFGRFTLQGIAGVEFGNSAGIDSVSTTIVSAPGPYSFGSGTPGVQTTSAVMDTYNVRTRFFDQINIKYYINDDWVGYIGHRYLGGRNAVAFGSEYGFALGQGVKAAAFVEARAGEADAQGVWGGMKFYFSPSDTSLMARHRRDDPNNWSLDSLFGIVNSHASSASTSPTQFCDAGANLSGGRCFIPAPPSVPMPP